MLLLFVEQAFWNPTTNLHLQTNFFPFYFLLKKHISFQDICGDDLIKALQIKNKIPRRKALSSIEDNVLTILTEEGYVFKEESSVAAEDEDVYEDEDEDEIIVVDGEVDEGDVHIKPVIRKPMPLVSLTLFLGDDATFFKLWLFFLFFFYVIVYIIASLPIECTKSVSPFIIGELYSLP